MRLVDITEQKIIDVSYDKKGDYLSSLEIAEVVRKDCKKFLQYKIELFRGTEDTNDQFLYVEPHEFRNPLNSSHELTEVLNDIYEDIGSNVTRNNSVFTTTNIYEANSYGNLYLVFPIGDFDVLWNENIEDSFVEFEMGDGAAEKWKTIPEYHIDDVAEEARLILMNEWGYLEDTAEYNDFFQDAFKEAYDRMLDTAGVYNIAKIKNTYEKYFHHDLSKQPYKVEVMVKCNSYYAIKYETYKFVEGEIWR